MVGQWSKNSQNIGLHEQKLMILPMKKIEKLVEKDRQEHIVEVYVKYPKELPKKHNEMPFLMKIEKVEKLAPNLKD